MEKKFANLGTLLSRSQAKTIFGGCVAPHCDAIYSGGISGCLTSAEVYQNTGVMFKDGCREGLFASQFDCMSDYCNMQDS